MKIEKVLASTVAKLDSDVHTGGGTDDTAALQAVLDRAANGDGIWLVMDGAALISGLKVHSNTTIECLTKDCGFFQIAHSNQPIVTNAHWNDYACDTRNITLIGGTYNQDCRNQEHDIPDDRQWYCDAAEETGYKGGKRRMVFGMEFYGVAFLTVRDLIIRNFRTYAATFGCFQHLTIENVWLDLPDHIDSSNQDGFHFWGPSQFLTVRNVGGRVGDDFCNIGPDERDKVSSITDVLIDGVFLDHADQAIRLLSRDKGRLDRVTIRNISGHYKSFGFFINPWFSDSTFGNFGHITVENVDLEALTPNYTYRPASLFSVGGNIESLTLKNIHCHASADNRTLFELGFMFGNPGDPKEVALQKRFSSVQKFRHLTLSDIEICEDENAPRDTRYITLSAPLETLTLRNIYIDKRQSAPNGSLLSFTDEGRIGTLLADSITVRGLAETNLDSDKIGRKLVRNLETLD